MYLSDINRLEKYLAKFKYYVVHSGNNPTTEEQQSLDSIRTQIVQIEETLFNLRASKGSVSGKVLKTLKESRTPEFRDVMFTANEKGFSIYLPIHSYLSKYDDQGVYISNREELYQWVNNLARNFRIYSTNYNGQEGKAVPEESVQIGIDLNQIHPKLKMYSIRYTGSLEFNFEMSKKLSQNDTEREQIFRTIMNTLQRFINQKRESFDLPPLGVNAAE